VAAEKNSTLVLPFPVELLRFLERATPPDTSSRALSTTESSPSASNGKDPDMLDRIWTRT
jgi:hypothetical protein